MIFIENLNFSIGKKKILENINLTIPSHRMTALIGANGAGKSSLLKLMARLEPLKIGSIMYDDLDVANTKTQDIAKHVAILQQNTDFMGRFSVDDLLVFARYPYHKGRPKTEDYEYKDRVLNYFNLKKYQNRFIDELSGGQRQMVLVAMTFCQDTDYILLDEPLNNLDMFHSRLLMKMLKQAINDWNKSVILIIHDINYAAHYADYIVALRDGRVQFQGEVKEVLTESNISRLYQTPVEIIEHGKHKFCIHF